MAGWFLPLLREIILQLDLGSFKLSQGGWADFMAASQTLYVRKQYKSPVMFRQHAQLVFVFRNSQCALSRLLP